MKRYFCPPRHQKDFYDRHVKTLPMNVPTQLMVEKVGDGNSGKGG